MKSNIWYLIDKSICMRKHRNEENKNIHYGRGWERTNGGPRRARTGDGRSDRSILVRLFYFNLK